MARNQSSRWLLLLEDALDLLKSYQVILLCDSWYPKRGRPSTHGQKLNCRSFDFTKEGDYYVATAKVI